MYQTDLLPTTINQTPKLESSWYRNAPPPCAESKDLEHHQPIRLGLPTRKIGLLDPLTQNPFQNTIPNLNPPCASLLSS